MTGKIHWRCFHCGETFTLAQKRWAGEHFGRTLDAQPVCEYREAGESAVLAALRKAEDELSSYRSEDNLILRAAWAREADQRAEVTRAEQKGYDKGVSDARDDAAQDAAGEDV